MSATKDEYAPAVFLSVSYLCFNCVAVLQLCLWPTAQHFFSGREALPSCSHSLHRLPFARQGLQGISKPGSDSRAHCAHQAHPDTCAGVGCRRRSRRRISARLLGARAISGSFASLLVLAWHAMAAMAPCRAAPSSSRSGHRSKRNNRGRQWRKLAPRSPWIEAPVDS